MQCTRRKFLTTGIDSLLASSLQILLIMSLGMFCGSVWTNHAHAQEHDNTANTAQFSPNQPDDTSVGISIKVINVQEQMISGEQIMFRLEINLLQRNGFDNGFYATFSTILPVDIENPISNIAECSIVQRRINCNIYLWNINVPQTVDVKVWVKSDAFAEMTESINFSNEWTISSRINEQNQNDNKAPYSIFFTSKANLTLDVLQNATPTIAGNQLTYDITVWNYGPDKALNVALIDTLPALVTFANSTIACNINALPTLTCDIGNIPVSQSRTFSIRVIVDPDIVARNNGSAFVTNKLELKTDSVDPYMLNNHAELVKFIEELSDLVITNDCKSDQPIPAGSEGFCTILIENLGPSTARQVTLLNTLFSNTDFQPSTISTDCTPMTVSPPYTKQYQCALGNLLKGHRSTVIVPVTANEPQDIGNHTIITSETPEKDPLNNQASDSLPISALVDLFVNLPDLPDRTPVSNTLLYKLEVENKGPSTAHDVILTSTLPSNVTIGKVDGGTGRCFLNINQTENQIICNLGTISGTVSNSVTIAMTPTAEVTLQFLADVTAREQEKDPINNRIAGESIAFIHRLYLPITSRPSDKADLIGHIAILPNKKRYAAGELVQLSVVITNIGLSKAEPFWVDLYINPSSVPSSANLQWQQLCTLAPCFGIAWNVTRSLAPGEVITLTSTNDHFVADFTNWPGWFASGTSDIYIYIDSYSPSKADGSVLEANEANNIGQIVGLTVMGNNPSQAKPESTSRARHK